MPHFYAIIPYNGHSRRIRIISSEKEECIHMKKNRVVVSLCFIVIGLSILVVNINSAKTAEKTGIQLFKEHCSMCHPEGGNIISPKKSLSKKDREANNLKTTEDIIRIMRKPGPGMTAFDAKSISDKDAQKIADYIHTVFSK